MFYRRLLVVFYLIHTRLDPVQGGCYQTRMCCSGRNNSCKSIEDGIQHIPTVATLHNEAAQTLHRRDDAAYHVPYYESSGDGFDMIYPTVFDDTDEKIGRLVLPDIIELEGSGAEKYENMDISTTTTTTPNPIKRLIFGEKYEQKETDEDILRYTDTKPKHLLIRFSLLNKIVPLRVETTSPSNYYYLESGATDCYCDEHCIRLGDCCSDYTFVCPPNDCLVSEWSDWSGCRADNGQCGIGVDVRERSVERAAERGGAECPPLKEARTCFVKCKSQLSDLTTVALLLDYSYNASRKSLKRNNIYWDVPSVVEKLRKSSYYCVHYEIEWVNRNCVSHLQKKGLSSGSIICAECQPESQLHRNTPRCASDLDDGHQGFWKLIGPKSCNGIWTRLNRTDDCRCSVQYALDHPFLLV